MPVPTIRRARLWPFICSVSTLCWLDNVRLLMWSSVDNEGWIMRLLRKMISITWNIASTYLGEKIGLGQQQVAYDCQTLTRLTTATPGRGQSVPSSGLMCGPGSDLPRMQTQQNAPLAIPLKWTTKCGLTLLHCVAQWIVVLQLRQSLEVLMVMVMVASVRTGIEYDSLATYCCISTTDKDITYRGAD
jgi:hypothetical protein